MATGVACGTAGHTWVSLNTRLIGIAFLVILAPTGIGSIWGWLSVHPSLYARAADETPGQWGIPFRNVTLDTADGLALSSWYTPPKNSAVILVGHGFKGARSPEMHALFARHGYGALSWDFRAHGASEGQLCTFGYYEVLDVEAALDYALAQPGVVHVGIWGGSLGGIAAIQAAIRRPEIEAIVVDSVPSTMVGTLERLARPAMLRPFVRFIAEREMGISADQLRPVDQIGRVNPRPLFIIQGTADSKIPADSARDLYRAAGQPRFLWLAPDAEHLAILRSWPEEYERRVIEFFDAAIIQSEGAKPGNSGGAR